MRDRDAAMRGPLQALRAASSSSSDSARAREVTQKEAGVIGRRGPADVLAVGFGTSARNDAERGRSHRKRGSADVVAVGFGTSARNVAEWHWQCRQRSPVDVIVPQAWGVAAVGQRCGSNATALRKSRRHRGTDAVGKLSDCQAASQAVNCQPASQPVAIRDSCLTKVLCRSHPHQSSVLAFS